MSLLPINPIERHTGFSPAWQQRFLKIAFEVATWSKDGTQVGAVLVNRQRRILATGYNGLPAGMDDSKISDREWKIARVVHAEMNALANAQGDVRDAILFVTHPPCNDCAKHLAAFGIGTVVFARDDGVAKRWDYAISEEIFKETGIHFFCLEDQKAG